MYHTAATDSTDSSIMIRAAGSEDVEALDRLAQRDSRAVPEGELLIALVGTEVRAAISLVSGETVADPFHPTEELVDMLTMRASELGGGGETRGRRFRSATPRTSPAAPQPASSSGGSWGTTC
jgi:hypothetical protein